MTFYPITIPTLCRYEHFRRCVESLSRNTHAKETELIIGLDYPAKEEHQKGYEQICEYLPQITGFKKVTIFKRDHNYGASANNLALREYAFAHYDACIFSEDDNEFSPCFLDFMNKALDLYKDEPKITSVCGYTAFNYENIKEKGILFTHDNCAWGMALWKHKESEIYDMNYYRQIWRSTYQYWTLFLKTPSIATMFADMMHKQEQWGDVMRTVRNIKNETFQVRPYTSLVRNWGHDGTGLHCIAIDKKMEKQKILKENVFNFPHKVVITNSIPFIKEFAYLLPKNILKLFYNILIKIRLCLNIRQNSSAFNEL